MLTWRRKVHQVCHTFLCAGTGLQISGEAHPPSFLFFSQGRLRLHILSLGSCLFVTQKRDPPFSFKKENGGSTEPSPDAVDTSDALDSRRGNGVEAPIGVKLRKRVLDHREKLRWIHWVGA